MFTSIPKQTDRHINNTICLGTLIDNSTASQYNCDIDIYSFSLYRFDDNLDYQTVINYIAKDNNTLVDTITGNEVTVKQL